MTDIGFLFDENVPPAVLQFLRQREPEIRTYAINDGVAPPKGTPDSEILHWIEEHDCLLITNNRSSMPVHLRDHTQQDRHVLGIIQLPRLMSIPLIVENLILIWEAGSPGEFRDQLIYLPL